jgi:hypothetical protein
MKMIFRWNFTDIFSMVLYTTFTDEKKYRTSPMKTIFQWNFTDFFLCGNFSYPLPQEDCRQPPPHQQRLWAWEHLWASAAASSRPQGIFDAISISLCMKIWDVVRKKQKTIWDVTAGRVSLWNWFNCFSMAMQNHGVDIYLNGHDHCLQRITSIDRWARRSLPSDTVVPKVCRGILKNDARTLN